MVLFYEFGTLKIKDKEAVLKLKYSPLFLIFEVSNLLSNITFIRLYIY